MDEFIGKKFSTIELSSEQVCRLLSLLSDSLNSDSIVEICNIVRDNELSVGVESVDINDSGLLN